MLDFLLIYFLDVVARVVDDAAAFDSLVGVSGRLLGVGVGCREAGVVERYMLHLPFLPSTGTTGVMIFLWRCI